MSYSRRRGVAAHWFAGIVGARQVGFKRAFPKPSWWHLGGVPHALVWNGRMAALCRNAATIEVSQTALDTAPKELPGVPSRVNVPSQP
ncbi:MAG TPA: hypothetical protein VI136_21875 [Verrucomicrobiae bacterium]